MARDETTRMFDITPEQFELEVKGMLEAAAGEFEQFEVAHKQHLMGVDGAYEIDITVRFRAFGADFLCLVECKRHRDAIKRDYVQVLHARMQSLGAQKGVLFSVSDFQRGAIEYARTHGIALVVIKDGASSWLTRSYDLPARPPPSLGIPPFVGWLVSLSDDGLTQSIVSTQYPEYLRKYLAGSNSD